MDDTRLLENLKNGLLNKVTSLLNTDDEFIPFGLLQTLDGRFRLISISDEDDEYTIEKAVKTIQTHIDNHVSDDDTCHSGGYCQDFLINDGDAIHLNLISKTTEGWVRCYLPYYIQEDRSVVFGNVILDEVQKE